MTFPNPVLVWPREWATAPETSFRLVSNSLESSANALNPAHADIYGPHAQYWQCEIPVGTMDRRTWQKFGAFFSRAAGRKGLIRMFDPKRIRPGRDIDQSVQQPWADDSLWGDGSGWSHDTVLPPAIKAYEAAAAGAESLVVTGLPVSLRPALWAGDLMEVRPAGEPLAHGHLYELAFDAPSDASGRSRIYVNPGLRIGVAAGDQIRLRWATSVFRAVDANQGILAHSLGGAAGAGFTLIEVIP